jgi:hypothetical protein
MMAAEPSTRLGIVLPLYDEEAVVDRVIDELRAALLPLPCPWAALLVNNGSADGTGVRIDAATGPCGNGELLGLHLPQNRGYGGGLRAGLDALQTLRRPAVLGWAWGDAQIDLGVVPLLLQDIDQGADLAKVIRTERQDGALRRINSAGWGWWTRRMGAQHADLHGCPKLFRAELLRGLPLRSDDWFLDAELMMHAAERGLRVAERPAAMRPRPGGRSKVRPRVALQLGLKIAGWRLGWRP